MFTTRRNAHVSTKQTDIINTYIFTNRRNDHIYIKQHDLLNNIYVYKS